MAGSPGLARAGTDSQELVKLLIEIRIRNQKIKTILKKQPAEDVEEFINTNQLIDATVVKLLSLEQLNLAVAAALGLQDVLKNFQAYLQNLDEQNKLRRYLTNSHLRGKVEQFNSSLDNELRVLTLDTKSDPATRVRSFSKISDDEGQQMWGKEFGNTDQVRMTTFIRGLGTHLKSYTISISEEDEKNIAYCLDSSNSGYVTSYRFSEFLKGFGPLRRAVPYMRQVMAEKWFYGFLSGEEVTRLLTGQAPGTFLVRFSRSRPGSFALSFVWTNGSILPVLISGQMPLGLKIKEQGEVERSFNSLYEVIDYYKRWLTIPFSGSLSKESWFHGDITPEETEEILGEAKPGTFLIRFGEVQNTYFCSFVNPDGKVQHVEIRSDGMGALPQEQRGSSLSLLQDYIKQHRAVLRYNYDPEGLPLIKIKALDGKVIESFAGPEDPNVSGESNARIGSGRSISTYPGGPAPYNLICDRYALEVMTNWTVLCIADGCNWGPRPCEAAQRASVAAIQYMKDCHARLPDLKEVGHRLLRSFNIAHQKILEGKSDALDAGTTTLLCGVLVELADSDKQEQYKHAFVCASVGDCKAFLWSPARKKAIDITARNRGGIDPRDPGGRLGPHLEGGQPDLRNLKIFFELCDIVMIVSDGVHDNLDPKSLGKEPSDFGLEGAWEAISPAQAEKIKQKFQTELLGSLLAKCTTPRQVAETLTAYSLGVTKGPSIRDYFTHIASAASREFMEQNPRARQPPDYKRYPGKMDHSTCVAAVVGSLPPAGVQSKK